MSTPIENAGDCGGWVEWPAKVQDLPSLTEHGAATGRLSRWSPAAAGSNDLDSPQAGIIAAHPGQDRTFLPPASHRAQSANTPHVERMAPGLVRVTFHPHRDTDEQAAGPETGRATLVSGLAAAAWQTGPGLGVLCEYSPKSWHHPYGIRKVLRRLLPRLPDVSGGLFLTLTFDRKLFADAGSAHDTGRPQIRKVMNKLRHGVDWEGKHYQIEGAYCVKMEFHEDDWPHYHLIILTRRYVPRELVTALWGNGICDVRRINNHKFHYLLKYVTKSGRYPEWVLNRKRLRVFQPSHGFMIAPGSSRPSLKQPPNRAAPPKKPRASYTIGQRLYRWERMVLYNEQGQFRTLECPRPFREIFDAEVLSIAEDQRYLGNGFIKINQRRELATWIMN